MEVKILLLLMLYTLVGAWNGHTPDPKGYIVFCPCMGRFGNQADQFLGSLQFAKLLDRTLVLPPWVEYNHPGVATSSQIPFDKYFKVEPLQEYHRVVLMEYFMEKIAPEVWQTGKRTVFCYRAREGGRDDVPNSCNAKNGNPFGPFWDNFNIDFDDNEFFGPLLWSAADIDSWKHKYDPEKWPVIAFTGAPADFPVSEANAKLHKYLQWSDSIAVQAEEVIEKHLPRPFIGAHLRIGSDWANACRHVSAGKRQHLFASPQCLGSKFEHGLLTEEMCLPSVDITVEQLISTVHKYKANSVFLARDSKSYDQRIVSAMNKLSVSVYWLPKENPHLDLAVLAQSDHYIGNCVSSFSAFATRERRANGRDLSFWAFAPQNRDEL